MRCLYGAQTEEEVILICVCQEVKDKTCVRLLEKFTRTVRDMLQKLKTENGAETGCNLSLAESEDDSLVGSVKASQVCFSRLCCCH